MTSSVNEKLQQAVKLHQAGQLSQARKFYGDILRVDPLHADALHLFGVSEHQLNNHNRAVEYISRAISQNKTSATFYGNLGSAHQALREFEQAANCFRRAIELDSESALNHFNLGNIQKLQGDISAAIESYNSVLERNPEHLDAKFNRAILKLMLGEFQSGWLEYECRWQRKKKPAYLNLPEWDGTPLSTQKLLVYAEQGVGDEIMYASCLGNLKERVPNCVLECDHRLMPILKRSFPDLELLERPINADSKHNALPVGIDYQTAIGSLPRFFRPTAASFPRQESYLIAGEANRKMWKSRFESLGLGLKIGISWRGGAKPDVQDTKSTQLMSWKNLLQIPNVHWVNLQYGQCEQEIADIRNQLNVTIHDWDDADPLTDMESFAAEVAELDLVISVANATVHFSGALGVETWGLLSYDADWRWLRDREDSVWYRSLRLIRQKQHGDWSGSLEKIARDLLKLSQSPNREKDLQAVMADVSQLFQTALGLHQQGDARGAEKLYRQLLNLHATHADALHLLGVALHQQGQHESAAQQIQKAISENPQAGTYHCNLGAVYRALNREEDSEASYRTAIRINPQSSTAHYNLGNLLKDQAKYKLAVQSYQESLRLKSDNAEVWNNLGLAYKNQDKIEQALEAFERALKICPTHRDALNNQGATLFDQGHVDQAFEILVHANEIHPDSFQLLNSLGNVYRDQGNYAKAIACFKNSIKQNPKSAEPAINLAQAFLDVGQTADCLNQFENVIQQHPEDVEAHFHQALAWLTLGQFDRGWDEYEWRWQKKPRPHEKLAPEWLGESLVGKSILVYAEQGIGDEILFASCLSEIIEQSDVCHLECDPRLAPLFQRSFPALQIIAKKNNTQTGDLPVVDYQTAIGSLPRFYRKAADAFPREKQFLIPDSEHVNFWKDRLAELDGGLKVGISWRGGKDLRVRRARSIELKHWQPLISTAGVSFIDLQYGSSSTDLCADEKAIWESLHRWPEVDALKKLDPFAALVSGLDLVISIDNSTVHLAGALGVPCWCLLPHSADWRWSIGCEDSHWYPAVKLFRQSTPRDWPPVLERVQHELQELSDGASEEGSSL